MPIVIHLSFMLVMQGIHTVQRAIINIKDKDDHRGKKGDKEMLVEGYGLQKVMITDGMPHYRYLFVSCTCGLMLFVGIVGEHATTNHIIETAAVLGIEAARANIVNEIQFIMKEHGMSIDPRHIMLLGDVMTYKVRHIPLPLLL